MTILLVEDNPADARLVAEALADTGSSLRLEHAGTMAAAEARLTAAPVDAVLLDLSLPDAQGLETLRRIRAAAPQVPVVVLTGTAHESLGVAALQAGAQDYLLKGRVDGPLLVRALRYATERQEHAARAVRLAEAQAARVAAEAHALESARLYEDAQRAIRLRDDFLALAAHGLFTPITALQLAVQSLQRSYRGEGAVPDPARMVDTIARQTARLITLIQVLLDAGRIESGHLVLKREAVDLAAVARSVVDTLDPRRRTVALDAPHPVTGCWDRARIEQVVSNLLQNALKYGEGKPVQVRVEATAEGARLVVVDQGIGMMPEMQRRAFGRFERGVSPVSYEGLGLGLYIVHHLVEAHGGRVFMESAPGRGSTFTVELPRGREPAPAPRR